ncbi:MAG: MgtC/SapB family protein [Rectinema sp.]
MDHILELLTTPEIGPAAAAARLILAFLAGGVIGTERELRRQTAGLRTHILISLGACLLMILSIWLPATIGLEKGDPGRIAAQVVSGIGFLGAGAFIKIGNNVKGMTTAASLWVIAAIGLTIGAGLWIPALMTLALTFFALFFLEPIERRLFPAERFKYIQIWFDENSADREAVLKVLTAHGIRVTSVDASQDVAASTTRLNVLGKIPVNVNIERLFKEIRSTGKVLKIKIEETL